MNLRRLKYFVKIVDIGSLTQAAEVLHIAQPALSQQVATLEGEMDQQLLIRTKRGVTPTEAGKILYTHARTILRQCEQAQLAVNNVGQTLRGQVSIGLAPGTAASAITMPLLQTVRNELPEVMVYLQESSGTALNDKLLAGQLDMAVLSGFGVELGKGLDSRVTLSDPCMVMISASHPLAAKKEIHPRELKGMPIVLNRAQDSQPSAGLIAGMYANMGLRENKRMYADDFYSIALIINTGIAFSIMPASVACWGIDGVVFRPVQGFKAKARTLLVYPRGSQDTGIQSFVSLIRPKR